MRANDPAKAPPDRRAPCYGTAMIRAKASLLPVLLPFMAAACSTTGNYPSLEQRDWERISGTAKPAPGQEGPATPALPPASADLTTRLDGLVAVARAADQQFQTDRPAAEQAVAKAGAMASDSWSTASIAIARLESSRSKAMVALADLDTLYVDARTAAPLEQSPSAKAIATAREQVSDWVAAQNQVIASLNAHLAS